ncbi:MAG: hypothetical protein QOE50_1504 [Sphingomonadales bacterium]|jgi:hypothetical protein|nr:hypothetical protein [Sphingomonadales bacterium]
MDDSSANTTKLDRSDEEILTHEVSDEALEAAASPEMSRQTAGNYTRNCYEC